MSKQNPSMTEGPLFGKMMFYTIPIIITGILQLLFNAADLVIVGQFGVSGSDAIAAVGCTVSITGLFVNFFIGCSAGGGVVVAHAIGSNNDSAVKEAVHTIIPFSIISGAVISVVGFLFTDCVLELMGTPADIFPLAAIYMKIIFAGMLPNLVYNFGAAILRAAGDSKRPLYYLTFAGVVNVLLNLVFVLVLKLDVAGVAIATVVSHFISAVCVVYALARRTDNCKLKFKEMKIHADPLRKILRMGVPAGVQSSLFSMSNVLIQSSINSLETAYAGIVAGNAATTSVMNFAFMFNEGFKQTSMNYAGQNVGAGKYDRVKRVATISLISCTVVAAVVGVAMTAAARPLLGIYITDSPQAIELGVVKMWYMCLPFFLGGIMDVTTGLLRGMGQSIFPMFASILGVCVFRVVWIYTIFQIPAYHTPESLWVSYLISWAITFLIQYIVFKVVVSRKIKKQKKLQV